MKSFKNKPIIKIIGIGGAGCNAINNIMAYVGDKLPPECFIAMNTDAQSLESCTAAVKVQIGDNGLGAGSDPAVGQAAAEYSREEIAKVVKDADLIIICTGLGGGTGSGASPVVASIAKEHDTLVVVVATTPFQYEGISRYNNAREASEKLCNAADVTVPIANQLLFRITNNNTQFRDAFLMVDRICSIFVSVIVEIIETTGLINVDFADIRSTILNKSYGAIGIGFGNAEEATKQALSNPLSEFTSMKGVKNALVHITGIAVTLHDIEKIMQTIYQEMNKNVHIIHGTQISEILQDHQDLFTLHSDISSHHNGAIRVMILATGITMDNNDSISANNNTAFPGFKTEEQHSIPMEEKKKPSHTFKNFILPKL